MAEGGYDLREPPAEHVSSGLQTDPVGDYNEIHHGPIPLSQQTAQSQSGSSASQAPQVTASVATQPRSELFDNKALKELEQRLQTLQKRQPVRGFDVVPLTPGAASFRAEIFTILTHNLLPHDASSLFYQHREKFDDLQSFVDLQNVTVDGKKNPEYVPKIVKNLLVKKRIPLKDLKVTLKFIGRSEIIVNLDHNNDLMTPLEAFELVKEHNGYMMSKATEVNAYPPGLVFYIFLHLMLALLGARASPFKGAAVFTRYLTDLRKGIGFDFDPSMLREKVASLDYLFIPIMVGLKMGFHYVLVVFSLKENKQKEVWFLDSTGRDTYRIPCLEYAAMVLKCMWPECMLEEIKMGPTIAAKKQTDETSCGVFVYHCVKSFLSANLMTSKSLTLMRLGNRCFWK